MKILEKYLTYYNSWLLNNFIQSIICVCMIFLLWEKNHLNLKSFIYLFIHTYLFFSTFLNASFGAYSKAFWSGYPWSISMKHMPTDSFWIAYAKYEYLIPSSNTWPYLTPFLINKAAWLSFLCFKHIANGVLP